MTPRAFTERMKALIAATPGDPEVRRHCAYDLLVTCLAENGFAEGLLLLEQAQPVDAATAARAVSAAREVDAIRARLVGPDRGEERERPMFGPDAPGRTMAEVMRDEARAVSAARMGGNA